MSCIVLLCILVRMESLKINWKPTGSDLRTPCADPGSRFMFRPPRIKIGVFRPSRPKIAMFRPSRPKDGMFRPSRPKVGMFRSFRPKVGMFRPSRPKFGMCTTVLYPSKICFDRARLKKHVLYHARPMQILL